MRRLYSDSFGRLSDPIEPEPMRFIFDQPYQWEDLPPADIREDFAGLCFEHGQDPQDLLDKLAGYLSSEMLGEFMDDLAMGRV
jgi:hypothetical protein